ncbi:MAG TPA: ABC transporter ATP-binding protein [Candidatus Paceibacterota bacterium]
MAKPSASTIPNTPIRYILFLLRSQRVPVLAAFLVVTLAQLLNTSVPYVFRRIIESAEGVAIGSASVNEVWTAALAFPLILALTFVLWRLSGFIGMRWMTRATARSYRVLFNYLGRHSHTYFSDRFAGSLSSKVTHASEGSQSLMESALWNYYPGILSLFITFLYISSLHIVAGVIFVLLLLILIPLNVYLAKFRRPHVVVYSEQATRTRGRLVDALTNMGAVRQYAQHDYEEQSFQSELDTMRSLNVKQWGLSEWGLVTNNVLIVLFEFGLVLMIVSLWASGNISTGELVMGVTLLMNINDTLTFIGSSINGFIRRYAEVEEGLKDILLIHEIKDVEDATELSVEKGNIEWQNVTFRFGENQVFEQFSLSIKPGERIGLVGHSGAGKTTFVSLLLRQHDLTEGKIMIDGQDIATITQASLRRNIAVVPQEPLLFHRTIRENILYGNPRASQADIEAVAKKAQAHDFIMALPDQYDTLVGERGVKLSGGQKQRVAIARAMLKNAPILILDEATSALDSESEVAIQLALHELMEGKTVVAIAHRLSTLREMDRIIVLEKGRVVEDGPHEALKHAGGIYQRLWEHQAGGFLVE